MALARPVGVKSTNVPSETGSPLTSTTFAVTTATEEPSAVTISLSVFIVIVAGIPTVWIWVLNVQLSRVSGKSERSVIPLLNVTVIHVPSGRSCVGLKVTVRVSGSYEDIPG